MEKLSLVNDNTPLQNHAEFHHSHLLSLSSTPAASQAEDAANVEMLPLTAKRPSVQFPPRGAPWGFACLSWRKWTNHCAHTDVGMGGVWPWIWAVREEKRTAASWGQLGERL